VSRGVCPIAQGIATRQPEFVSLRVVIIDDDEAFRAVARTLLSSSGYTIAGAVATAAEARRSVIDLRADALLLDVNLPDGNGITLAAELRAAYPALRILLTSSDIGAAPRDGGSPFVAKTALAHVDLVALLGKP
jgi:DNA-binding NarL/FixJ family response regulator